MNSKAEVNFLGSYITKSVFDTGSTELNFFELTHTI